MATQKPRPARGGPDLIIIIDEPTEGPAPQLVELVGQYLQKLKAHGVAVLLIEQKLTIALHICDRLLVMGQGCIVFNGTPDSLRAAPPTSARNGWRFEQNKHAIELVSPTGVLNNKKGLDFSKPF